MPALATSRFLFVTGKGGAGKSTVSAGLALALARAGRRVLVAKSGPEQQLGRLLGARRALGPEIEEIQPRLWAVAMTPELAMREYGALVLKSHRLVSLLFDNRYVVGFLNGAPGLKEWALLGKAWYHAIETAQNGSTRFDVVVFDAPATGHGLDMLRVPKVILAAAPPGRLRRDAERALAFLRDPEASGIVIVTLPEEMPTNETLELVTALQNDVGLPVAQIVVNATLTPLYTSKEALALAPFAALPDDDPAASAIAAAGRRALSELAQEESLSRLEPLGLPVRRLPLLNQAPLTPEAALALGQKLI